MMGSHLGKLGAAAGALLALLTLGGFGVAVVTWKVEADSSHEVITEEQTKLASVEDLVRILGTDMAAQKEVEKLRREKIEQDAREEEMREYYAKQQAAAELAVVVKLCNTGVLPAEHCAAVR
jgi:hypothetical protein